MRFRLTIALALANLLAGGVLLFLIYQDDVEPAPAAAPMLPGASQIQRMEIIYNASGQRRVIEQSGKRWRLEEPVAWWANLSAVQPILAALESLTASARIPLEDLEQTGSGLGIYGLNPPKIELTFTPRQGEPVTVGIGETTTMGQRLYVLEPGGEAVAVVDQALLDALDRPVDDFIDAQLFDLDFFEITSLGIQDEQRRTLLEKTEDGWRFATPLVASADGAVVDALLGRLLGLQLVDILPQAEVRPELTGLDNPYLRLTLQADNDLRNLVIGRRVAQAANGENAGPPLRYARLEGASAPVTVFLLPADDFEIFRQAGEFLRERRFWRFDIDNVTTARIDQAELGLTLQRLEEASPGEPPAWQVIDRSPGSTVEPRPADLQTVREWLGRLAAVEAYRFVSDAPGPSDEQEWGLTDPRATISIETPEGTSTLLIGNRASGPPPYIYAQIEGERFVYGVPPVTLLAAQANPLIFRDRTLYALPESAEIQAIRIYAVDAAEPLLVLTASREGWDSSVPLSEREREAADTLATQLRSPEVRSYLHSEMVEPSEHPWAFRIEVDARLPGGGGSLRTQRLWLTKRLGGTQQIGASEEPRATFVLDQALIDALTPFTFEDRLRSLPESPQAVLEQPVRRPPTPDESDAQSRSGESDAP